MKRTLAIVLALVMVLGLCACKPSEPTNTNPSEGGTSLAGTYKVVIWTSEESSDLFAQMVDEFNKTNTDGIKFEATFEKVSEADAGTNMLTDVEAGADIFCFAQDQFARLVQGGALAKLGASAQKIVSEANAKGVVAAATSGNEMFAYPMTADNGYFMYYDKSVIKEDSIDSLEKLIQDCEAAGKFFSMELQTSAWYIASFFFGAGCHSTWTTNDEGEFIAVDDDFNSDKGLIAVKGMEKLIKSPMHLSSSKGTEFANGAAVVVSGIWDYTTVSGILGDNMGVTDLPSFTVDGQEYHMGSFNGCKLMGVKPQTDATRQAALHKLAQYLTNEENQMKRFNTLAWGPANSNAQKSEAVQSNPGLAALLAQSPYSVPQGQIQGSWWDVAKVIGDDVKAATSEADLKQALQNYRDKIDSVFTMSDDVKNGFTVIGAIGGSSWDKDFEMTKDGDVFTSKDAFDLNAGDEFKVRQGLAWDVAYGAEPGVKENAPNFKVETAGKYYIVLDLSTGTVSLKNA